MERRYIVLTAKGQASCQKEEFHPHDCQENEAILETSVSLISAGTELSRVFAIKQGFSYPVYPGYSAIGKVVKKGEGLSDIQVGDRVFYSGVHASINQFVHEGTTQGGKIMKINPELTDIQASLIPLGLIAMNVIRANEGKLQETAAVFGLGAIGIIAALLLKRQGMRIIGVDPMKTRCELAQSLGIEETIDCASDQQLAQLKQLTNQVGAEVCVDVSGASPAIVTAMLAAAKHGQVILLGSPRAPFEADMTPMLNAIHMKMLTVKGAFNELNPYDVVDGSRFHVKKDFDVIQRLILDKTLDADKLISHIIAPDDIQAAYHGLMYQRDEYHCVVIDWSK